VRLEVCKATYAHRREKANLFFPYVGKKTKKSLADEKKTGRDYLPAGRVRTLMRVIILRCRAIRRDNLRTPASSSGAPEDIRRGYMKP
jgi:hypothetical protein